MNYSVPLFKNKIIRNSCCVFYMALSCTCP